MKILCAEYNEEGEVAIVPMGDDVLLRNNDDFYLPDFADVVSAVPQLVVRICKLGKCVGERFAGRYYEEIGVGVRFYADHLETKLQCKGLPPVVASSFGGSAAISGLIPRGEAGACIYEMKVNGRTVGGGGLSGMPLSIEQQIALASDYHTLKIGDFLYCGNALRHRDLKPEDHIQVDLNGVEMMNFKLK